MQTLNNLSRSLIALEPASTLIAVIEMSLSSWLVAGIVPGIERQPLKKLAVDESALLRCCIDGGRKRRKQDAGSNALSLPSRPAVTASGCCLLIPACAPRRLALTGNERHHEQVTISQPGHHRRSVNSAAMPGRALLAVPRSDTDHTAISPASMPRGSHAAQADPAQSPEQCLQVHERGHGRATGAQGGGRPRLGGACGRGQRHWDDS